MGLLIRVFSECTLLQVLRKAYPVFDTAKIVGFTGSR